MESTYYPRKKAAHKGCRAEIATPMQLCAGVAGGGAEQLDGMWGIVVALWHAPTNHGTKGGLCSEKWRGKCIGKKSVMHARVWDGCVSMTRWAAATG